MITQTILYISIAGILALSLVLFQYVYKSKKRSKINIVLSALRFVSIFLVLLLLINPKFEKTTYYNEKPNLVIAVDNSESIAYLNQNEKTKQLIASLKNNETLKSNFNVELYSFGKTVNTNDTLTFTDKQTNVSKVFNHLSQVYKNTTAPTVLISDGNQTYGDDYEFTANYYKQPIFPVILGDTTKFTDLKIQQLNVNKYAYLKNKFPIEIIALYNGSEAVSTELKITSGNAVVYSQNISFDKNSTSQVIQVTIPANRVGVRDYKIELTPLTNEKNKINNSKRFAVDVIDQKTNIALVTDIIHPDLGALKNAIETNERRHVTILNPNDYLIKQNDFQLVIAYQPNNNFSLFFKALKEQNTNCFVITGTQTNWSVLNNFQSNYTQEITNETEDFQPTLNSGYTTFIVEDLDFSSFPPLQSEFGETQFSVPIDPILYKTINGNQTDEPLLATFEVNNRREALLNGEGIWRWRSQSFLNEKSFNNFDNFIGKIVQYLSDKRQKNRLNIDYESFYSGNNHVIISAQYFNKNYEFDANANINITLKHKIDGSQKTYPFILKNNNYQVDLSGLLSGQYTFTVSAVNKNISKSGELRILDYNVEQQFLNANVTKLQKLADNSQGKNYFIDNTNTLIDDLVSDTRFATIQKNNKKSVSLIDWKYALVFIILCLTLEWFIRKYNGLI